MALRPDDTSPSSCVPLSSHPLGSGCRRGHESRPSENVSYLIYGHYHEITKLGQLPLHGPRRLLCVCGHVFRTAFHVLPAVLCRQCRILLMVLRGLFLRLLSLLLTHLLALDVILRRLFLRVTGLHRRHLLLMLLLCAHAHAVHFR